MASNKQEACDAVDVILTEKKYGSAGETVVIEELIKGEEVSVSSYKASVCICRCTSVPILGFGFLRWRFSKSDAAGSGS